MPADEFDPGEPSLERLDESTLPTARAQVVLGPDISRVVDESIRALATCNVYQREGALVDIVQSATSKEEDAAGIVRADGSARIRFLPTARLQEMMGQAIDFKKKSLEQQDDGSKKVKLTSVPPPRNIVTTLEARGQWDHIRPLNGIVRWPVLRADGTVCTAPGYDFPTGLIFEPTCEVKVLERPTEQDARDAIADLCDLVSDFPFVSTAHRAAWLACLLSLVGRAAINGPVPLTLIDASAKGSGKSLLADVIGMIVLGKRVPRRTQCANPEEWRKAMLAIAIAADPIILFDNVVRELRSDVLDAVLTGDEFRERVLGKNEELTLKVRTVFAATANNATLSADLVRRSLHVRIEPEDERPEQRAEFKYFPLLPHVEAHRARYLGAALTVLRAYFVAGRPAVKVRTPGSYEDWSAVVQSALVWAGQPDPVVTQDGLREGADSEHEVSGAFIRAWHGVFGEDRHTVAEVLGALNYHDNLPPNETQLRAALLDLCSTEKLPNNAKLGSNLRRLRGKVHDGLIFERAAESRDGAVQWRTRRVR